MNVALAHDYLTQRGGAERVVLEMVKAFPTAPLHVALYEPASTFPEFATVDVRPSWLNRSRTARRNHRAALPLLPLAASSTVIDAEVVLASSSGWSHGFRAPGRKIVYCYSPARWLYQTSAYLGPDPSTSARAAAALFPALRLWDRRAARSADQYVAISRVVQTRIWDAYGIEAPVVHAPHSIDVHGAQEAVDIPSSFTEQPFLLCLSRLLPYKNVGQIVEAVRGRAEMLIVVGVGPEAVALRRNLPENVCLLSDLTDAQVRWLYDRCLAVVAASYEDFGLTPLEAAAFGRPSVVLRWGGFLDTVEEGQTGLFFDRPDVDSIRAALDELQSTTWDQARLREQALRFSPEAFRRHLLELTSV